MSFYIKPNTKETEEIFNKLEDVEKFLIERDTVPIYTSKFDIPSQTNSGQFVMVAWCWYGFRSDPMSSFPPLIAMNPASAEFESVRRDPKPHYLSKKSLTDVQNPTLDPQTVISGSRYIKDRKTGSRFFRDIIHVHDSMDP